MDNFFLVAQGIDTSSIRLALHKNKFLWNQHLLRTTYPDTPHRELSDIWLRFNDVKPGQEEKVLDDNMMFPYPGWYLIPQIHQVIFDLMREVKGVQLGRVIISKLPPGKQIYPHADTGFIANYYTRFQLCLQSGPGCIFTIEDEQVCFKDGELWMIDQEKTHSVVNNSKVDRLAAIIDIRIDQ